MENISLSASNINCSYNDQDELTSLRQDNIQLKQQIGILTKKFTFIIDDMKNRIESLEHEKKLLQDENMHLRKELSLIKEELNLAKKELNSTKEELYSMKEELGSTKKELYKTRDDLYTTRDDLSMMKDQLALLMEERQHNINISIAAEVCDVFNDELYNALKHTGLEECNLGYCNIGHVYFKYKNGHLNGDQSNKFINFMNKYKITPDVVSEMKKIKSKRNSIAHMDDIKKKSTHESILKTIQMTNELLVIPLQLLMKDRKAYKNFFC